MTFDYSKTQATANRLLNEFGQTITFSYETGGTFDPVEGGVTGSVTVTQTVRGVLLRYRKQDIDGTAIQQNDLYILSGEGVEPQQSWTVEADSKAYQIINVEQVNPAGTPVLYKTQVRV